MLTYDDASAESGRPIDVADPENTAEHYYLLKDLYTVTGLAGSNSVLEEAYVYDTYGQAVIHAWPVGDVNRDGLVESLSGTQADFNAIAAYLSQDEPRVDLDISGAVDMTDLVMARDNDTATPTTLTYSGLRNPFLFTGRLTDTLGADAPDSPFSLGHLLEHRVVQRQVRHQLLEPGVFELELLEPLGFAGLHAAVLVPPAVEGGFADLQLLADLADRGARPQHRVRLTQLGDDLLRRVSGSLHREPPPPAAA